jgi:hypothetical protein
MPTSYAEVTYDEFWVAALTLTNYSLTEGHNIDSLRDTFVKTANSYVGVTGRAELNDAATDRKYGSYDFWAVRPVEKDIKKTSSFEWTNVTPY